MTATREVSDFVERWAQSMRSRSADRAADLYLRDPAPLVTFSNGERTRDWIDVRVRLQADFQRVLIDGVDVHDLRVEELGDETLVAAFAYDLHARDIWGLPSVSARHATLTLVRTKDGLRIAAGHFSRDA